MFTDCVVYFFHREIVSFCFSLRKIFMAVVFVLFQHKLVVYIPISYNFISFASFYCAFCWLPLWPLPSSNVFFFCIFSGQYGLKFSCIPHWTKKSGLKQLIGKKIPIHFSPIAANAPRTFVTSNGYDLHLTTHLQCDADMKNYILPLCITKFSNNRKNH